MLSRWLNVGLKAARTALESGRIDEAFQRLQPADVRKQRNSSELTDDLGRALLARARVSAQAGRYHDALEDLARLQIIDRLSDDTRALRARVEAELQARAGRHAKRDDAFQNAAENLKAGRLESGRIAIERLEDVQRREQLREELDVRVQRSDQLIEQARSAMQRSDILTACRFWEEAVSRHGRTMQSDAFAAEAVPLVRSALERWFADGQLDRLRSAIVGATALLRFSPALAEYERLAQLADDAAARLAADDFDGLRACALRLRAARGNAAWVEQLLGAIDRTVDARAVLLASPLGALSSGIQKQGRIGTAFDETIAHNAGHRAGPRRAAEREDASADQPAEIGAPLLLLVDGTGSALMLTRSLVRIGRAGGSGSVDVPMPADIQSHHADVVRDGDAYFLVAHGPAKVNQRSISRTLLKDGDRIVLGGSGKFVFHKPSAKSDTAVLVIGDRCRLPQDVSAVVLFKETCVLGPTNLCHLRTREGDSRLVLFEKGGKLYARKAARDGHPTGPMAAVPMHETREFGDVRLTVKAYL